MSVVAATEHKAYGVGSVQDVNNRVHDRHEGDHYQFIPVTARFTFIESETIKWPHHHSRHIHHCCQNVIADH